MSLPRFMQPRRSARAADTSLPLALEARPRRLWLSRLALACAALSGGLAGATTAFPTSCQEQGGTLSANLITAENGGTFGSIAQTSPPSYRNLESADRPGSPYSYSVNTDGTGRIRPEGTYAVTSSYGSGRLLDTFGPWQAYTGHTNGSASDAYLAVNGAVSEATFLNQMITVEANTNYEIGLWGRSTHAANSAYGGSDQAARLAIYAGTMANGVTNNLVRGDDWERGSIIFNSGNQTSIPVTFRNISTAASGNDFYVDDLFLQKCVLPSGTISGKVYRDNNANAVQDAVEPGIQGVSVKATDKNGSVATVTTNSTGTYTFSNLALSNGPYKIEVVGSSTPLSDLTATTPTSTSNVGLKANTTVPGGNFGYKPPTPPVPDSGVCKVGAPYVQSFKTSGPLAEVRNHSYLGDANTVTTTDGTYTVWNQIDHTGDGGYGLYYNVANFENRNGGTLAAPGLLYESQITVPAGANIDYENWIRSHSNTATQLQYRFYDGVSGTLLKSVDGAVATTNYTKQTASGFTSPSSKLIIRIYTLKDGTTADANVVKLDDLKLSCGSSPALSITKTHSPATFQVLQPGSYSLNVSNAAGSSPTSGTITVKDKLPVGIGAALPSGFSPASGWTCTYSGEAEQGRGYAPNPNEAQLLTCTSSTVVAAGGSVTLNIPVNVTPAAGSSVLNKASVGGGGDLDVQPDPATCTVGAQCAQDSAPVTPLTTPPATCTTGTPTNLLSSTLKGYQDNDSATIQTDGVLIANAAAYSTGTGPSGSFVIDGSYFFNNGYGNVSKASTLQLIVNGTVYASFLTENAYSGRATVTPQNGATLPGGVSSMTLNRYSNSPIWITLPASLKSVASVQIKFISTGGGGEVSDDYNYNLPTLLACVPPAPPKAVVGKTVQNISAGGPVTNATIGKPGDVLEYCIKATNIGGSSATKLALGDNIPASTAALPGGYGAGKDIKYTLPNGTVQYLTFAADADTGLLGKDTNGVTPRVIVSDPALVLAPQQSFEVCFRTTIN